VLRDLPPPPPSPSTWSGAKTDARSRIFLAEFRDGRLIRLESGRGRTEVVDHVIGPLVTRRHPRRELARRLRSPLLGLAPNLDIHVSLCVHKKMNSTV
jgi:hypothetical protein